MPPYLVIIQFVLQYGLPAFREIIQLAGAKEPPTLEQWNKWFALAQTSYDDYVRGTALPAPPSPAPFTPGNP